MYLRLEIRVVWEDFIISAFQIHWILYNLCENRHAPDKVWGDTSTQTAQCSDLINNMVVSLLSNVMIILNWFFKVRVKTLMILYCNGMFFVDFTSKIYWSSFELVDCQKSCLLGKNLLQLWALTYPILLKMPSSIQIVMETQKCGSMHWKIFKSDFCRSTGTEKVSAYLTPVRTRVSGSTDNWVLQKRIKRHIRVLQS